MALKVFAELDGVECPHPGEVKTHVQKDTLFCDRYGRRVNFNNKFCRQYIKNEPSKSRHLSTLNACDTTYVAYQ